MLEEGHLRKNWFQDGEKFTPQKESVKRDFWTRYAEQDAYEWFAESFSFWAMGDLEKVNPLFIEMIEEIMNDAVAG